MAARHGIAVVAACATIQVPPDTQSRRYRHKTARALEKKIIVSSEKAGYAQKTTTAAQAHGDDMKALLLVLSLLVGVNHQPPIEDGFSTLATNSVLSLVTMPTWQSVDNGNEQQDLAPPPATPEVQLHHYLHRSLLLPAFRDVRRPGSADNAIRGPPSLR